jgi:hypothetical protein
MAVTINIPSQVKTYANLAAFPASGSLKTIFIAEDTNKTYRWTGSVYVEISGADFSGYVPTSRTLTINGTTQDLSANRTFTVPTDLTIGTTPISSGTIGRVLFQGTGNVLQQSSSLFWDSTNNRLGIGTSSPAQFLDIQGTLNGDVVGVKLRNTATNGYTEINCFNNAGTSNDRMYMGIGGTATGDAFQNRGYFFSASNLDGINFTANKATTGDIRFFTGGVNERLRIHGNGNVLINTTTDAGFRLDVNGTARVSGTLTLNNTSGTNRSTQLSTSGSSDNLPSISFYPATGTNVGQSFDIIPKGTGYSSGIKTQFGIWGTDFIANQTNYELLLVRATGSSYTFESFKGGAGAHRPILFSAGASNQLWAYTSGNIGINTTTDAGFRLDVNGTARVSGGVTSGVALVGTWSVSASYARFGHNLFNGGTTFGFLQQQNGDCFINGPSNFISASNNNIFETNGAERMRITSSGNVLIGTTTNGASKLRVVGLPTSSAGLSAGDIWNDGGTLKIV